MKLHELMSKIELSHQEEFLRFIETGEASEEFYSYLDGDSGAQEAVDAVFASQAKVLVDLAAGLRADAPTAPPVDIASQLAMAASVRRQGD